jgi:hypothetical protein
VNEPLWTAKAVFDCAHELPTPEERRAYLDGACGENAELRLRVEALLRAYEEAGSFLDQPAAAAAAPTRVAPGPGLDAVFSPLLTIWIFLGQVLDPDHSSRQAVLR